MMTKIFRDHVSEVTVSEGVVSTLFQKLQGNLSEEEYAVMKEECRLIFQKGYKDTRMELVILG